MTALKLVLDIVIMLLHFVQLAGNFIEPAANRLKT
jgi:hypothetical protein